MTTLQEKIDYELTRFDYTMNAKAGINNAIQELREEIEALRTCKDKEHCAYCINLGHVLDLIGEKQ